MKLQRITPFLWFDNQAHEAAKYYCSIFKNSKVLQSNPMVCNFKLDGQQFLALNGGPQYKFTEAISFVVNCETQKEVDYYWKSLSKGGKEVQCGWLKDKYGLCWQITPTIMGKYMNDKDPVKAKRVFDAMLKMVKFDIKKLEDAYKGK
jgi:predicted 3-demethylubiquinone-9 3-methyltransferase (glyoxalase superfamily)